ncbi:MAG: hypothetical protein ACKVOT_11275 [Polaromonas sp.]
MCGFVQEISPRYSAAYCGMNRLRLPMRSHIARQLFILCLMCASTLCRAQPSGVVVEPFKLIFQEVRFEVSDVDLNVAERAKLETLVQSIFHTDAAPVHECDFDVFLFEGFRSSESGITLQRMDHLFERRVLNLKRLFSHWGISERVGVTIKPSETRPLPGSNPNSVAIEIRHRIHGNAEKYEPTHLDCKWPLRQ